MVTTCPQCLGEGSIKCLRFMEQGEVVGLLSNSKCHDCKGMGA